MHSDLDIEIKKYERVLKHLYSMLDGGCNLEPIWVKSLAWNDYFKNTSIAVRDKDRPSSYLKLDIVHVYVTGHEVIDRNRTTHDRLIAVFVIGHLFMPIAINSKQQKI